MRLPACALAVMWALPPGGAGAQPATAADQFRVAIVTQDFELNDEAAMVGGTQPKTYWRFSPPDRLSIESRERAGRDRIARWRPDLPGRYAFRDGRLCLTVDNATEPRCFSIAHHDGTWGWRLASENEVILLSPIDRKALSRHIERYHK